MDPEKRLTIVREIEHWQRSKLLPDQYCDFLLNLYRDEQTPEPMTPSQVKKKAVVDSNPLHWIAIFGIGSLICFFFIYFSYFDLPMQIGLLIAFVAVALGMSAYFRKRRPVVSYLLFGVGAGSMLFGGSLLLRAVGAADWGSLTLFVAGCSLVWIVFGLMLKVPWIHFCGWAGLFFAYAVLVNRVLLPENEFVLQLCWLPICFLFAWIGWLLSSRSKSAGAVFFIWACLLWFAPELYSLGWMSGPVVTTQLWLLGKLVVIGAIGFALRKTWIEWVV